MRLRNQDLFEQKKMPFGDHLDELRSVLFRSLIGIVAGFVIGLMVAKPVIRFVERPLQRNLQRYLTKSSMNRLEDDVNSVDEEFKSVVAEHQLVLRPLKIERSVLDFLQGKSTSPPEEIPTSSEFVTLRLWEHARDRLVVMHATEPFMSWLKAGFLVGLLIASPYVLWQIWSFVAAGLYRHERKGVYIFLPMSLILFLAGAALAFFLVFDPVLEFLFSYAAELNIELTPRLSDWMGFVLFLPIGFGIAFQLPLVMLALYRMRIVPLGSFIRQWRVAMLAIAVASMLLTPQEPISMLAMAVPLLLLYFLGIGLCSLFRIRDAQTYVT